MLSLRRINFSSVLGIRCLRCFLESKRRRPQVKLYAKHEENDRNITYHFYITSSNSCTKNKEREHTFCLVHIISVASLNFFSRQSLEAARQRGLTLSRGEHLLCDVVQSEAPLWNCFNGRDSAEGVSTSAMFYAVG